MAQPPILVAADENGLATVTFNRPTKRNCVNLSMWYLLAEIFGDLGQRRDVRAIILSGNGGHFCAGADISEFPALRCDARAAEAYEGATQSATLAIFHCPKPTIAQISGYCVGGGCGLALACDFRVSDTTARIGISAARLGIVYGPLDCELLLSIVGLSNAKRVLYSGDLYSANDAKTLGLIDIVSTESSAAEAAQLVKQLTSNAPLSIQGSKMILNALARGEAAARTREIENCMRYASDSADYREGTRAFLEKRKPTFRGE